MGIHICSRRKILLVGFIIANASICLVDNCYCFPATKLGEKSKFDFKRSVAEPMTREQEEQEDTKEILMELKRIRAIREEELEMRKLVIKDFKAVIFVTFFAGLLYILRNINAALPYLRRN